MASYSWVGCWAWRSCLARRLAGAVTHAFLALQSLGDYLATSAAGMERRSPARRMPGGASGGEFRDYLNLKFAKKVEPSVNVSLSW